MKKVNIPSISQQTLINAINFFEKTHGQTLMIQTRFETNLEKELPLIEWVKQLITEINNEKPYFEYIRISVKKRTFLSGDFKGSNDNTEFSFGTSVTKNDKREYFSSINYLFGFIFIQFSEEIPKFKYKQNFDTDYNNQQKNLNFSMNKIVKYSLIGVLVFITICVMKWYRIL